MAVRRRVERVTGVSRARRLGNLRRGSAGNVARAARSASVFAAGGQTVRRVDLGSSGG